MGEVGRTMPKHNKIIASKIFYLKTLGLIAEDFLPF